MSLVSLAKEEDLRYYCDGAYVWHTVQRFDDQEIDAPRVTFLV